MKVTTRVGRFATLVVVLLLTAAPRGGEALEYVCRPIVAGDTASALAHRLTGNAATRHTSSFQVLDPARVRFVPKSRYDRLSIGWQACIARGLGGDVMTTRSSTTPSRRWPAYDTTLAWQVGLAVSLLLAAGSAVRHYVAAAAPIPPALERAGEQFVGAFARPLMDPSSTEPPIKVRLRFVRHARQLEICIAPNAGRRYPNLSDHKQNVEYDIHRVMGLLAGRIVSDRLRAEGQWVVVPIRLTDPEQAGAT